VKIQAMQQDKEDFKHFEPIKITASEAVPTTPPDPLADYMEILRDRDRWIETWEAWIYD
jgi:hypothetical protein